MKRNIFIGVIGSVLLTAMLVLPFISSIFSEFVSVQHNETDYSIIYVILLLTCIAVFNGAMLGYHASIINQKRKKNLVLLSLIYYYVSSLIISTIITSTGDWSENYTLIERIAGAIKMSLIGSIIFAIFMAPFIILGTLLLERITRKTQNLTNQQ